MIESMTGLRKGMQGVYLGILILTLSACKGKESRGGVRSGGQIDATPGGSRKPEAGLVLHFELEQEGVRAMVPVLRSTHLMTMAEYLNGKSAVIEARSAGINRIRKKDSLQYRFRRQRSERVSKLIGEQNRFPSLVRRCDTVCSPDAIKISLRVRETQFEIINSREIFESMYELTGVRPKNAGAEEAVLDAIRNALQSHVQNAASSHAWSRY